jgi:hypothetical protein
VNRRLNSLARDNSEPERGAALILGIGVMMLVGMLSAALLGYITTSVQARSDLDVIRNRQYAADAAVEDAIERVRGLADPGPGLRECGGPYSRTTNGITIVVHCENNPTSAFDPGPPPVFYQQRNVVFWACETACSSDDDIVVRAQINYEVPAGSSTPNRTYVQSWSVNR